MNFHRLFEVMNRGLQVSVDYQRLCEDIKCWGTELGFRWVGVSSIDLAGDERRFQEWLAAGYHGEMSYMARHGLKRSRPAELVPGTCRVISASMDYLPEAGIAGAMRVLRDPHLGYVARYALGRDYHKVLRRRLARLLQRIVTQTGQGQYRVPYRGANTTAVNISVGKAFCSPEGSRGLDSNDSKGLDCKDLNWNADAGLDTELPGTGPEPKSEPDMGLDADLGTDTNLDPFQGRVFVDSAPVLEKALARNAGLGWIGKHGNLIQRKAGSCFLLGEIYTNVPLPVDTPSQRHCGTCRACITACPTEAIVAPYRLDARKCVAYLTMEYRGVIPLPLRERMGNRIFGCDDCQIACPWNRFARTTGERDFSPRNGLDAPSLVDLFRWSEAEFQERTAGSALRRIGYECWLRNIAVAMGNAPPSTRMAAVLEERVGYPSPLVAEHVAWALARHR
uniref:Epoxyqueuosine reductase n=1 Tax=Candidatus Kentrum sp. LFY TaxID=2126342 RepID=A0A450ULH4_9GAMM|nr:MAG: epoxyqueuosine reductase [Candidatus Kentron sp. LFY]